MSWLKKYGKYLALGLAILGLYFGGFYTGWKFNDVHYQNEVIDLQEQFREKEQEWIQVSYKIAEELENAKKEHETGLASLRSSFDNKLRQSEKRASVYKRQAASTESERQHLADYAARLDRCIVEGQQVVGELAGLIELRDRQLELMGDQLKAGAEMNK